MKKFLLAALLPLLATVSFAKTEEELAKELVDTLFELTTQNCSGDGVTMSFKLGVSSYEDEDADMLLEMTLSADGKTYMGSYSEDLGDVEQLTLMSSDGSLAVLAAGPEDLEGEEVSLSMSFNGGEAQMKNLTCHPKYTQEEADKILEEKLKEFRGDEDLDSDA